MKTGDVIKYDGRNAKITDFSLGEYGARAHLKMLDEGAVEIITTLNLDPRFEGVVLAGDEAWRAKIRGGKARLRHLFDNYGVGGFNREHLIDDIIRLFEA